MRIWGIGAIAIVAAAGVLPGCGALLDLDVHYVGVDGGGSVSPDAQMSDSIGLDGAVADVTAPDQGDGTGPDVPDTTPANADAEPDADADGGPSLLDVAPGDATPVDSSPEGGIPEFVQVTATSVNRMTSMASLQFDSDVQAHDTIVVAVDFGVATGVAISGVTDTRGNTFMPAVSAALNGTTCSIWYAIDVAGGTDKVTATTSAPVGQMELYIHEYSGISGFDVQNGQQSGMGALMESGFATTTAPNDLVFGFGVTGGATASSGFTLRSSFNSNVTEDRIAATPGSYEATANNQQPTQGWIMLMAAFLAH